MPTLPTFTVTATQAARITAAFNGNVTEYRQWLKEQIIAKVIAHERSEAERDWREAQVTKALEVQTDLDNIQ